jgi:protein-S-isoprenylcysteine O-methyltransferase Ste14
MSTESFFHTISLVVIGSSMTISIYFRHKANQTGEKIDTAQEGAVILNLRRIFGLLLWLSILAYLINPAWMRWSSLPLPIWLRWLGVALMAACLPLIYWIFSSLGKNVTPTVVTRQAHSLVTHGPYRWVRHPLYTVGFLAFAGLSLAAANWFMGGVLLLGMIPLALRTPLEEARLIERFGDEYQAYMQQTGRYLPRLASFRSL